jgi:hypothetical protein
MALRIVGEGGEARACRSLGGLFVAQTLRGWLQGVVQPMMFSVQLKQVRWSGCGRP